MERSWKEDIIARLLIAFGVILLLGISPRSHRYMQAMQLALKAVEGESYSTAALHFSQAAAEQPWRKDLWEEAARHALAAGDPAAAVSHFQHAGKLGALPVDTLIDLSDAFRKADDPGNAMVMLETAASQGGKDNARLYDRLAQAHLEARDYPAAIEDLKTLVAIRPNDGPVHYQLGLLLAATLPRDAQAYLSRAAEIQPALAEPANTIRRSIDTAVLSDDPAYSYIYIGRTLASLEEWAMAGEAFRQATLIRPDYGEAWAFLGEARQHLAAEASEPQAALLDLQKGWTLDPRSVATNSFLALYWQRQGRYDMAMVYLQAAASIEPRNPVWQAEMGRSTAEDGDLLRAQSYYQKAIDLTPSDPTYWRLLAEFSLTYQSQVHEVALPAARQAVTLAPGDAASLDLLGLVFYHLEDYHSAERFLLRALKADPDFALAHLHLGMNYLFMGDAQSAHDELSLAQVLDPESPAGSQARRLLDHYFP